MAPWPWVTAQVAQISMGLAVAQPSDTHMATSCNLDPGYPCGLWSQPSPLSSIQAQTWSKTAALAHGPRWQSLPLKSSQSSDTNMALGDDPDYRPLRGPSVVPGATDINSGSLDCFRASDLGNSPGRNITLDLGGKQAVHISLFLTILTSSICRSPQPMKCSVSSLSLFSPSCSCSP